MGSAELNKIKRGESSQAGRGFATAGMWLGIVNVILIGLIILAYVVIFVILIGLSTTTR